MELVRCTRRLGARRLLRRAICAAALGASATTFAQIPPLESCSYNPSSVDIPYRGTSGPVIATSTPSTSKGCINLDGVNRECNATIVESASPLSVPWGHLNTGVGTHVLSLRQSADGPALCSLTFTNLPPPGVPTLSDLGTIMLALLVGAAALLALRRGASAQ